MKYRRISHDVKDLFLYIIDHDTENYDYATDNRYILDPEEIYQLTQYKFELDMRRYLISHISLRILLAIYSGTSAEKIRFRKNNYGKPYILNSDLYFNLSHSNDRTIIAIYKKEIGVDIEYICNDLNIEEYSELIFTKREKQHLISLNSCARKNEFFRLWTRKEALLKAIGTGITEKINEIDVSNNEIQHINNNSWKIDDLYLNELNYKASVAYSFR